MKEYMGSVYAPWMDSVAETEAHLQRALKAYAAGPSETPEKGRRGP
mgnify:CR=1 FL=1